MSAIVRREAAAIRREWLGHLLSTRPADRPAAEAAISELYLLIGLDPPRFHWVSSPAAALLTVPPRRRLRATEVLERLDEWPVPARLSRLLGELRGKVDRRMRENLRFRARRLLDTLIQQEISVSLARSFDAVARTQIRAAYLFPPWRFPSWYGMLCVSHMAYYDALRRMTGMAFGPWEERVLDLWTTVNRSCILWWPRTDTCTVSERPVAMHTEVWGDEGEVRLHHADGPAVRYADGWDVHAWHGTSVPSWVIDDPSVERIAREENVEIRRCAIERVGWAEYIDRAGLRLVASAPDPGNPGAELRLYDMRGNTRVLLAVNGSAERDGHRRRYGLTVPGHFSDPIAAAGWTYGLSAEQYSQLVRRT
ncbi:DUF6745 domain-containing protein [Thermostaphylospora chromogena]|uniref:DUF6745 domain-containing protein n=1 Tax=Thermostaphylospora chromogena TaxID=35622 RepID=UPI000B8420CC|nr:hypothetical protein [Thermostaphylospora chromogena]